MKLLFHTFLSNGILDHEEIRATQSTTEEEKHLRLQVSKRSLESQKQEPLLITKANAINETNETNDNGSNTLKKQIRTYDADAS